MVAGSIALILIWIESQRIWGPGPVKEDAIRSYRLRHLVPDLLCGARPPPMGRQGRSYCSALVIGLGAHAALRAGAR